MAPKKTQSVCPSLVPCRRRGSGVWHKSGIQLLIKGFLQRLVAGWSGLHFSRGLCDRLVHLAVSTCERSTKAQTNDGGRNQRSMRLAILSQSLCLYEADVRNMNEEDSMP
eukprot:4077102-Amphidinium_carterae.2